MFPMPLANPGAEVATSSAAVQTATTATVEFVKGEFAHAGAIRLVPQRRLRTVGPSLSPRRRQG
jgi:hypothetical protein